MADSDASRSMRLLALAVHELRTPATVIGGCLRMARMFGNDAPERLDTVLEQADRNYQRLVEILAEISDLWRLETGEAVFNSNPVGLERVITNAVTAFSARSPSLRLRVGALPTARVNGDPTRLEKALVALLAAVARHLDENAEIAVDTTPLPDHAAVRIIIAEAGTSGPPAPPDLDDVDELQGGLGLSLPIARRVIEHEGGTLRAFSGGSATGLVVDLPTV